MPMVRHVYRVSFGVRQGSVHVSIPLCNLFIDDLAICQLLHSGVFISLYPDDIFPLAPSDTTLEKLLHACENELCFDMIINIKNPVVYG